MAPIVEGCARCPAAEQRRVLPGVQQHLGGALWAALAETTMLLSPLMGGKGWGAGTRARSSPLGARTVAAGLRDTVPVGQRQQTPYKPQQEGLRALFSSGDSPAVIKRLESSCSPKLLTLFSLITAEAQHALSLLIWLMLVQAFQQPAASCGASWFWRSPDALQGVSVSCPGSLGSLWAVDTSPGPLHKSTHMREAVMGGL